MDGGDSVKAANGSELGSKHIAYLKANAVHIQLGCKARGLLPDVGSVVAASDQYAKISFGDQYRKEAQVGANVEHGATYAAL